MGQKRYDDLLLWHLNGLEREAEAIEIVVQLKVNCHCDKCCEQVHSAMNDNSTDI